jgi:hypothetical protein
MSAMKFTIDRIESGIAVLISQDDPLVRINLPVPLLPPASGEGSVVSLSVERDDDEARAARDRVARLQEKLKKSAL